MNVLDFLVNGFERHVGLDLNGDGYIGGEGTFDLFVNDSLFLFSLCIGFLSRLERKTHIDFNGDNIIGRRPDVYYGGYPSMYGGGHPSMYGGYGYSQMPYGSFY